MAEGRHTPDIVFFGGTALSRTHLTDLRLSEDIDLIAFGDRSAIADKIERALTRQLRRSFGTATFTPPLRDTKHPDPSVMQVGDVRVQIQLLSSEGYPAWPTEVVDIEQRYSDAPPARLRVLTPEAFVASKLASWNDREAARAPSKISDRWRMQLRRTPRICSRPVDVSVLSRFKDVSHQSSSRAGSSSTDAMSAMNRDTPSPSTMR